MSAVHTEFKDGCPLALLSRLIYWLTVDCLSEYGGRWWGGWRITQEVASSVGCRATGSVSLQGFLESLPDKRGDEASAIVRPYMASATSTGVRMLRANEA